MTDKIDMSLDDIIKKNKTGKGGRGGGGRGGGASRRGRGGASRGAGGARRVSGGRGAGRGGRRGAGITRKSSYTRGNPNASWNHDMYDGPRRGGVSSSSGPTKLIVSNLDFGVSNNDIQELFSEFGRVKNATVHYDKSGRSLGSADVIFERKGDAIKAMKQYNGVPLDGRPMSIQLATSEVTPAAPASSRLGKPRKSFEGAGRRRSGGRVGKPAGRGAAKRGGGRGRGGRGGKKEPAPNADDLDKEMDTYMKAR